MTLKSALLACAASLLATAVAAQPAQGPGSSLTAPAAAATPKPDADGVVRRVHGTLTLENVPETPPEVREALRRYSNARGASFRGWLPDGSVLISTRFGQTSQVHRVAAPGADRSQLTFYDEPVGGAVPLPAGANRFVFTRDTGGGEYFQAYLAGLTGAPAQLTEPNTRNESLVVSRDGSLLAWSRVTPGAGDYDIQVMAPGQPASRRIALTAVAGRTGAVGPEDIAPDNRSMVYRQGISATSAKLFTLDLATGATRLLTPGDEEVAYGAASFIPGRNAVLTTTDRGSDVQRLVELDLATLKQTPVSPADLKWDVEDFALSDDGATLAYTVNEDGFSRLVVQDFKTRRALPQPKLPKGGVGGLEFSPDGRRLGFTLTTATSGSDVWSAEVATGVLTRWTASELGGLDPAALSDAELIRFRSFDGVSVPAFVYRPPSSKTGQAKGPTPVVISIHGGPEGQELPGFVPTYQYWAGELGYTVIAPNVRGSSGYGKAWLKADNGLNRLVAVKDIGALLDWIATQPGLDKTKVIVYGGSYGGYMSLATFAEYNDRLAGAIDIVGISDFKTFLQNTEGYRRDLRRVEYGDERVPEVAAFFEQIAPLNNAAKMKKPLFVIQGRNDPRVPYTEAKQIVAKVRANGQEVWYMEAADEGHGFRKKQNRDAQAGAETLFMRKVLGGGE